MEMTKQCESDIKDFIKANIAAFIADCIAYDCYSDDPDNEACGLEITIGTDGESWGFQTGDNSFTGGAYGFPIWGVSWVTPDTTADELIEHILDQINDQLWELESSA